MVPGDPEIGQGHGEDVALRGAEIHAASVDDRSAQHRARRREPRLNFPGLPGQQEQRVGGRGHDHMAACRHRPCAHGARELAAPHQAAGFWVEARDPPLLSARK